jgi:hypothetical protein
MTKTTIAISIDLDQLELLSEIKIKYHLKNLSKSVDCIIRQWQMMLEQKKNEQIAAQAQKKEELPDKYKTRKPVNPMVNP